ncbi:sugar phosphate nucleotidyltransferase [Novipirellula maiorica]|uniref:sugar phosphate nucleotidyltransferase n=1 Tax=Novipirellula maiorica TaxID=1265734 RepID=UPI0036F2C27E
MRKNLVHLQEDWIEHVLILSGDQLYRMDFRDMLRTHIESGADATIAGIPVSRDDASSLGIMQVNDSGRVTGFVEKPQNRRRTGDSTYGSRLDRCPRRREPRT